MSERLAHMRANIQWAIYLVIRSASIKIVLYKKCDKFQRIVIYPGFNKSVFKGG